MDAFWCVHYALRTTSASVDKGVIKRGEARRGGGNDKEVKEEKGNSTCEKKHEHKHEVEKATMKDSCNCK